MSEPKENKLVIDDNEKEQPSEFFDMNADCWLKIFDNLSLRDILSMSAICQRMLQIGGYYFRQNFHGHPIGLDADLGPTVYNYELEREEFLKFVDTVTINFDLKHLKRYSSMNLLGSLTTLRLTFIHLDADVIENFGPNLRKVLDQIENLHLCYCKLHGQFYGQLFASCANLKTFRIRKHLEVEPITINNNRLLQYTYPKLELFEFVGCRESESHSDFISFLGRNPTLKRIEIDAKFLMEIGLNTSEIQLDYLEVNVTLRDFLAIELANRLKALHANGFYTKLHLIVGCTSEHDLLINEMASFGALEVLTTHTKTANIFHLTGLKELYLLDHTPNGIDTLESIAKQLTSLERVWIQGTADDLIPFLRHSKSLECIILSSYCMNSLNLCDLNHERVMGGSRRNVRIGVRENLYLATKLESETMEYDLVEVTRMAAISKHFKFSKLFACT